MESSIVELRPGRIADLQQRIKAVAVKIAKLPKPKPKKTRAANKTSRKKRPECAPSFKQRYLRAKRASEKIAFELHHLKRRREMVSLRLEALKAEGRPRICFGSRKLFNAQHHLSENGFDSRADWRARVRAKP